MHHSSSGKLGYDIYDQSINMAHHDHLSKKSGRILSINLLKKIIETEIQMRLSKDWQAKFAEIDSNQHWKHVVESLQEAAIRKHWEHVCEEVQPLHPEQIPIDEEFRDKDIMSRAISCLRSARQNYMCQISVGSLPRPIYVQYDRSRFGDLNNGDFVPDVISSPGLLLPLRGGDGFNSMWTFMDSLLGPTKNSSLMREVVVLIAGSIT